MITPLQAILLGIVEGLTEYLPVSSTGHLILTAHWLGLEGEGIKAFEVVIQSGAIIAVLGLYRQRVFQMWRGLLGRDPDGRALLVNLIISFLPAGLMGLIAHKAIKAWLFGVGPVVWALALGGLAMIFIEKNIKRRGASSVRTLQSLTRLEALGIGLAQCLALWPGTSRAMVTMLAAMLLGLPVGVAAEYSFLLALPTLGAATAWDFVKGVPVLMSEVGLPSLLCGLLSACVVAGLAIQGFVRYLTRHGLSPFGWYRLGLAGLMWVLMRS